MTIVQKVFRLWFALLLGEQSLLRLSSEEITQILAERLRLYKPGEVWLIGAVVNLDLRTIQVVCRIPEATYLQGRSDHVTGEQWTRARAQADFLLVSLLAETGRMTGIDLAQIANDSHRILVGREQLRYGRLESPNEPFPLVLQMEKVRIGAVHTVAIMSVTDGPFTGQVTFSYQPAGSVQRSPLEFQRLCFELWQGVTAELQSLQLKCRRFLCRLSRHAVDRTCSGQLSF